MESGQITSIILASLICGTITIGVLAQAWAARRSGTPAKAKGGSVMNRLDSLEDRLYRLEQAIDTVAVELERGTEAQRYTAKLLAERLAALPAAPTQVRNGER